MTAAGGTGLPGIHVTALGERTVDGVAQWVEIDTATTGADGSYNVGKLPDGNYKVRYDDPSGSYSTEFYNDAFRPADATVVELRSGKFDMAPVVLGGAAHLSGLVTGSTGAGIVGAEVTAYVEEGGAWNPLTTIETVENGRWDLGLLPGGAYKLGFHDPATGVGEYWNDNASLADADTLTVQNAGSTSGLDATLATPLPTPDPTPGPARSPARSPARAQPDAHGRPDLEHHGSCHPGSACSGRDDAGDDDDREGRDGQATADQGSRQGHPGRPGDPRHLEPDHGVAQDPVARQRQAHQGGHEGPPPGHREARRQAALGAGRGLCAAAHPARRDDAHDEERPPLTHVTRGLGLLSEQPEALRVAAYGVGVRGQHERHVRAPGVGDLLHASVARVQPHLADVDRQDPPGVLAHDVGVDRGVVLAGVAEEDEGQVRVEVEDLPDAVVLLLATPPGAEQVAQQDGTEREAAVTEEADQERVQVPRARRDVEDRVHVGGEVLVELDRPGERRAGERGAGEGLDDHPHHPLDAGLEDRVVDIRDDPEAGIGGRDAYVDRRSAPAGTPR